MCSNNNEEVQTNVSVNVDVPKIVKYSCLAGVLIIAIIFGCRTFVKMLELKKDCE